MVIELLEPGAVGTGGLEPRGKPAGQRLTFENGDVYSPLNEPQGSGETKSTGPQNGNG